MAARATASGTIAFGLVSIPVKLFTAASSESIGFNLLHATCGGRLKQQMYCPVDQKVVTREETVRGYEFARDQYVRFTDDELKTLEGERSNAIEIVEFVPVGSVDIVHVEKSYYLGPDKGGERAYRLLSEAMEAKDRVAVGRWSARGKDQLVLLRPYHGGGLILHQLHYATEVRSFDEIDRGAPRPFTEAERELAHKLIDQLVSDAFDAGKYQDMHAARIRAAIDSKVAGQEISNAPEQPHAQIFDLFEALKQSLEAAQPRPLAKAGPKAAPRKKPAVG